MKPHFVTIIVILLAALQLTACGPRKAEAPERTASMGSIFAKKSSSDTTGCDLATILKGGELIIATISSPEIYYEYHGLGMGEHYVLAENFAQSQGLSVRVEVVADTAELAKKVINGEADLAVYPLSKKFIETKGLVSAGFNKKGHWAVRKDAPKLAEALDSWYGDGVEIDLHKILEDRLKKSTHVERKAQAVYLSRERGVISVYDNLFHDASSITGWDWKLIAAMCYQESTFDPNAHSYAGACGLMQLMPRTAESMGLDKSEIYDPAKNVDAAARYIAKVESQFSDVKNRSERIKFVLASYNGGPGHVRDAMALAQKYGHNPKVWDEVAPYILGLSLPEYYKDPVVKRGYMVGRETANYVQKITERWHDYGGNVALCTAPKLPADSKGTLASNPDGTLPTSEVERRMNMVNKRPNRYSSGEKILRPGDPEFGETE